MSEWISVDKNSSLERGNWYLVYFGDTAVISMRWNGSHFSMTGHKISNQPTHWMPLPEPPK